jgi:excisionase family DNA binding protein
MSVADVAAKLMVSVKEAAVLLSMDPDDLYDEIKRGHLGCVRLGRAIKLPRIELDRWIAANVQRNGVRSLVSFGTAQREL